MELDRFILWAEMSDVMPPNLDANTVRRFGRCVSSSSPRDLQALRISKPLLASSLGQTRRIIGAWLRWAAAQSKVAAGLAAPVEWPSVDRRSSPSRPIAAKQLGIVIRSPQKGERVGLRRARERFVAGLAFWLCLNPAEIAALRREDVRIRDNELAVRVANGESMEWVAAPATVLRTWLAYDKARGTSTCAITHLRHPHPVSTVAIARIIRRIKLSRTSQKRAGSLSARRLKRSFIRHAIQCGWSSDDLRRHLRRQTIRGAAIPRDGRDHWQQKLALLDAGLP